MRAIFLILATAAVLHAETPTPPLVADTALRIEAVATFPDVEASTTVCGGPDGAIYAGNDPRDGHLSTAKPEASIVRFGPIESPDLLRLPDGKFAPPGPPHRKRTIFADKIYSPAGSAWHDGYLYVLHDPMLTRFKDTNGDGVADVREDLVTGIGLPPYDGLNDHVVSGFTLGMDGFFYISVGDRGIYKAVARDGSTITMQGGGIVRVRTDGTQLEIFSTGTRNHLEVNLDAEDNAFTRDNTDDGNGWWTRLTHHIEGGYYGYPFDFRKIANYGVAQPSPQTLDAIKQHGGTIDRTATMLDGRKVSDVVPGADSAVAPNNKFLPAMADFGGGSPTGGLCYLSDGLPEKYRGRHFFSEWGKGGVFVSEVARDGATFKLVSDMKLIEPEKGGDFRPMQLSVAADGSLLIADWGYGGWKSPKRTGAIWRAYWPEAHPASRLGDESKATTEQLIAALAHPDRDQRLRAEYALAAKGRSVAEKVAAALKDERAPIEQRTHALWVLEEIARGSGSTAAAPALARSQPGGLVDVRRDSPANAATSPEQALAPLIEALRSPATAAQAARALGELRAASALPAFASVFPKAAPEVRRAILTAIARIGRDPGIDLAGALTDSDPWVRFTARRTIQSLGAWASIAPALRDPANPLFEAAWETASGVFDPGLVEMFTTLRDAARPVRVRATAALGRIALKPAPYEGHWWGTQPVKSPLPPAPLAWAETPRAIGALTAALDDAAPEVRLAAALAFTEFVLGGEKSDALAALRTRLSLEKEPSVRRQLIEALGVQKDPAAAETFRKIALDAGAEPEFREAAIAAIVGIGGDDAKKTIAQIAGASLSAAATRSVIVAAGDLRVVEAAPALVAHLTDPNAGNREAAAHSLGQIGAKSGAGAALIGTLDDKDGKVATAAVIALGDLREKSAIPALIALAEKHKSQREVIAALASMPDPSAIPVLVETLRSKDAGQRRSAIKALKTMRAEAMPAVQALLASGRVPLELAPEIQQAFEGGAIAQWKMIGPFENVWEAVHPPETDALAGDAFLSKKYVNAEGKEVGWSDVSADSDGRVNMERVFHTNAMVCAYAVAEITASEAASTKLFLGVDDQMAVWLNGKRVYDSGPASGGFEMDKTEVPLELVAGKNTLLLKIGNVGGGWEFAARVPGLNGLTFTKSKEPTAEEKQRVYAMTAKPDGAWEHAGDAARGAKIFADPAGPLAGICATCHAVKGKGGQVGPDLGAVAVNYKRPDLIVSIHEPSKTIALGFEQVMVETKAGDTVLGALRSETPDALTLLGADAAPHVVKVADIKTRAPVPISLMPPGLTLGLTPEQFVDLLAFLETMK